MKTRHLQAAFFIALVVMMFFFVTHGGHGYTRILLLRLLGMGLFAWLSYLLARKIPRQAFRHVMPPLLIIAVCTYIPVFLGIISYNAYKGAGYVVANVLVCIFFFFFVWYYDPKNSGYELARLFIVAAFFATIFALVILYRPIDFMGITFQQRGAFRLVGPFATPNRFGEVPAVGAICVLYLLYAHPIRQASSKLFFVILTIATLASGSKGVILGYIASVMYLVFSVPRFKKKIGLAIIVSLVGGIAYSQYDHLIAATRYDKILTGQRDWTSGRTDLYFDAGEMFQGSAITEMLFGHGFTAFFSEQGSDSHSTYTNLLLEIGIWGLGIFLAFSVVLLVRAWRIRKYSNEALLGSALIIFCLVRGVAMPTVFNSFNFSMFSFWAGVALILKSNWLTKEEVAAFTMRHTNGRRTLIQDKGTS